jgi:hypothetical protein
MGITKSGTKLTVGTMNYEGKTIAKRIFDLKTHKGERIRVHIDIDDKYTIETNSRQKLLICELDIPELEWIHTLKIVDGETVVESSEKELKLGEITMIDYLKEAK